MSALKGIAMAQIEIKPYEEKYKEDVRNVCLDTAGSNAREPKISRSLLATFCDYYIERESGHCFVAVDTQEDKAVGYILCAPYYSRYSRIFRSEYMPRVKGCGFVPVTEAWGSLIVPFFFKKKNPAHMHIDIEPGYHRAGIGTRLMNTLLEHLKNEGVSGVMLIVGEGNTNARAFYKKCGFDELYVTKSGVVMARKVR